MAPRCMTYPTDPRFYFTPFIPESVVSGGISKQTQKRERRASLLTTIRTISQTKFLKAGLFGQDNTFTYEYAALFNDPGGSLGVTTF